MKKYRIYTVIVVFVISMCLSVRQNSFLVYANEQSEVVGELRNCRKISDTDCAVYFFEGVCQKM